MGGFVPVTSTYEAPDRSTPLRRLWEAPPMALMFYHCLLNVPSDIFETSSAWTGHSIILLLFPLLIDYLFTRDSFV